MATGHCSSCGRHAARCVPGWAYGLLALAAAFATGVWVGMS